MFQTWHAKWNSIIASRMRHLSQGKSKRILYFL